MVFCYLSDPAGEKNDSFITIAMQERIKYLFITVRTVLCFACLLFPFFLLAQSEEYDDYDKYEVEQEREYFLGKKDGAPPVLHSRSMDKKRVEELKKKNDFWYANTEAEQEQDIKESSASSYVPIGQRSWFQTILWIVIIGGFAAAVAWFLMESRVKLFRKRDMVSPDKLDEDIFSINYQKQIEEAVQQKKYRLAVRLGFLRLLKDMAEKNVIQYKQDRTNFDYLLQLQSTPFYELFFSVTRSYEYTWYGLFELNENVYNAIKKDLDQLQTQLSTR